MALPKIMWISLPGMFVIFLVAPTYILLLSELPLSFTREWSIAGVRLDSTDIVLGLVFLAMVRRREVGQLLGRGRIPYVGTWLLLLLLMSLSYLNAEINEQYLTSPVRGLYQLYRYCWKELLYFALACTLFSSKKATRAATLAIVSTGFLIAALSTWQGYATGGWTGWGTLTSKNALGVALLPSLALSFVGAIVPRSRLEFLVSLSTVILIFRAILFTGSRGSFASAVATTVVCTGALWVSRPAIRTRLLRLIPSTFLAITVLLVLKPDFLERPTIKRALTVFEGTTSDTMQWRMEQRWPHFWERAKQKPWLGYATPVDDTFGYSGNTPHNAFLALAVTHGFPAALLFVLFALRAGRDGLLIFKWTSDLQYSLLGLSVAGFVAGMMVNSLLESTIREPFIAKLFWLQAGIVGIGAYKLRHGIDIGTEDSEPDAADSDPAITTPPRSEATLPAA